MSAVLVAVLGAGLYAVSIARRAPSDHDPSTSRVLLSIVALIMVSLVLLAGALLLSVQFVGQPLDSLLVGGSALTPAGVLLSLLLGGLLGVAEALAVSFVFPSLITAWRALCAAGVCRGTTLPTDMSMWLAAVSRAWQPRLVHAAETGPRWAVFPLLAIVLSLQELLFRGVVPFYLSSLPSCAAGVVAVVLFCLSQCAGARNLSETVYPLIFGLVVGTTHLAVATTGASAIPLMTASTVAVVYTTMI